jgi:hypothetical protein
MPIANGLWLFPIRHQIMQFYLYLIIRLSIVFTF